MEAPLHHSPLPLCTPAPTTQQHDAIITATVLQQAATVSSSVTAALNPLPHPPQSPAVLGREQCPRCASRDTKFCYYNNYNTAQPRHFCRACRRYWTLGGSLRNVPVGGSTRKRPRLARPTRAAVAMASSSSPAATTTPSATTADASSCGGGPCFATASPAVVPDTAQSGGGLLRSLFLGSVPILEGRLGFDLGLCQPATAAAGDLAHQLVFGAGRLLWPATFLDGSHAADTMPTAEDKFPPTAATWQELAAAMPAVGARAPQLLL